jgi:hypothetical protein
VTPGLAADLAVARFDCRHQLVGVIAVIGLLVVIALAKRAIRDDYESTVERSHESARAAQEAVQRMIVRQVEDMSHPPGCAVRGRLGERLVVHELGTETVLGTVGRQETPIPWSGRRDVAAMWIETSDFTLINLHLDAYGDAGLELGAE